MSEPSMQEGKCSVVYVSEAVVDFDDSQLQDLEVHAAERNASIDVTGYLYYANGRFVQYLEGVRESVTKLLGKIEQDTRHKIVATIWEQELAERRFPNWEMRWVRALEIREIGLEELLADYVVFMTKAEPGNASVDLTTQRMVASVAKFAAKKATPADVSPLRRGG